MTLLFVWGIIQWGFNQGGSMFLWFIFDFKTGEGKLFKLVCYMLGNAELAGY